MVTQPATTQHSSLHWLHIVWTELASQGSPGGPDTDDESLVQIEGGGSLQSRKNIILIPQEYFKLFGLILDDRCHCNIFNDNNSQLKNISLFYSDNS